MTKTTTPTTHHPRGRIMIDRAHTEEVTYLTAVAALRYYPGKEAQDPGYTLAEDVDWCLRPLTGLPDAVLADIRHFVQQAIIDPTGNRVELQAQLNLIADE